MPVLGVRRTPYKSKSCVFRRRRESRTPGADGRAGGRPSSCGVDPLGRSGLCPLPEADWTTSGPQCPETVRKPSSRPMRQTPCISPVYLGFAASVDASRLVGVLTWSCRRTLAASTGSVRTSATAAPKPAAPKRCIGVVELSAGMVRARTAAEAATTASAMCPSLSLFLFRGDRDLMADSGNSRYSCVDMQCCMKRREACSSPCRICCTTRDGSR